MDPRNIFLCILNLCLSFCCGFQFDQKYFGVVLETDVHLTTGSTIYAPAGTYTFETIKTMLTVISEKFSNVIVSDPITFNEGYLYNHTYWRDCRAAIFSGEAAAIINRESGRKKLSLLYYIYGAMSDEKYKTSISLVFEAAQRANEIFPDTVQGLYLGGESNHNSVTRPTLKWLQYFKGNASRLGLKMGARLTHAGLLPPVRITGSVRKIVEASDFIVFGLMPGEEALAQGPVKGFHSMTQTLVSFRNALLEINPSAHVIAITQWYSSELEEWETIENLQTFWETSSKWAAENKYNIYQWEAFDNPWRAPTHPEIAQRGWWRLTDNSKINIVEGYVEKISEKTSKSNAVTLNPLITASTTKPVNSVAKRMTTQHPNEAGIIENDNETGTVENGNDTGPFENENEAGTVEDDTARNPLIITLASTGGLVGILILLALLSSFLRRKQSPPLEFYEIWKFRYGDCDETSCIEEEEEGTVPRRALNAPYDESLEISKEKLKIDKQRILGVGQFGCVFKGLIELDNGKYTEIAVKSAKRIRDPMTLKGLLQEIKVLSYLGSHPNIVALRGAYTAELASGLLYVALEFCSLGSLKKYLIKGQAPQMDDVFVKDVRLNVAGGRAQEMEMSRTAKITLADMLRWTFEIARGMEHLELKHIVHADLATRNVLLTFDKTAKVADFGLSRRMYNYSNYVKKKTEPLPWRWMAIESLRRLEFSSKSDVWSYGVTLWEIFSMGDVPYPELVWGQDFIHRVSQGTRPECPLYASPQVYKVMRDCWNYNPKERPNFTDLVVLTKDLLRQCQVASSGSTFENPRAARNSYVNMTK